MGNNVLVVKCKTCGKEFEATDSRSTVCSKTCSRTDALRRKGVESICEICGKPFIKLPNERSICFESHSVNCAYCGKPFSITREEAARKKQTCSQTCRRLLARKTAVESGNLEKGIEKQKSNYAEKVWCS